MIKCRVCGSEMKFYYKVEEDKIYYCEGCQEYMEEYEEG